MNNALDDLMSNLCRPIMAAADAAFSDDERAAFGWAPLLIATTRPLRVALMGFDQAANMPVDCGCHHLTTEGGHALARFFERAMASLSAETQRKVLAIVTADEGQLVVSVRVDRGEAACALVAHHDRFAPVTLFTVHDLPATTIWH